MPNQITVFNVLIRWKYGINRVTYEKLAIKTYQSMYVDKNDCDDVLVKYIIELAAVDLVLCYVLY